MPAARKSKALTAFWKLHRGMYRLTGGRLGTKLELPVLLLTTVGRKSKQERTVALYYLFDDEIPVVIGSNVGQERNPAWIHNLRAHPRVGVQMGRRKWSATAREANASERDRIWPMVVAASSSYEEYQQRTDRKIPLVLLEPTTL